MQVMKFGGASIKEAAGVKNVAEIIRANLGGPLLVVVSAMDKTTNQLEILAWNARDGKEDAAWTQFSSIMDFHLKVIQELFAEGDAEVVTLQVAQYFSEVEKITQGVLLLGEFPHRTYDRIVAYGELIATCIVSHYLNHCGITAALVDARTLIRTDASYTQANVVWTVTRENITRELPPLLETHDVVIAPGFIASSLEGKVTTLGREGSDYSAAIFASCLGAEKMTVWKDVPGIMSGDPRTETEIVKLEQLSYEEAVEMTFYGATVLHPKTIKPLFNAGIPLYVRSFKDQNLSGSVVTATGLDNQPTSRITKKNLALLTLSPHDFSFMDETLLGQLFAEVAICGINLVLVQTTAIQLSLVVDHKPEALQEFESRIADRFSLAVQRDVLLRTILNFTEADRVEAKDAVLVQQAGDTLFIVRK